MTNTENTSQTIYRYPYFGWFPIVFNTLAVLSSLIPVFFIGIVISDAINRKLPVWPIEVWVYLALLLLFSCVFFSTALVLAGNFLPEIRADQNGLLVSFLWYRLPVPWQDIIELKPCWFNLTKPPVILVVRTRVLTPFHRLYGLLYGFTSSPSFIVRRGIENSEDLIRKINQRRFE